ncbi:MAG TPA: SPFH domain-containing protein [Candidatus Baltobacteraceae bacterium]|jgi:membrane protease subunit HflC|nr:SPFH domain-containing protein [Candidatus Baltobacteraceae bacterium]
MKRSPLTIVVAAILILIFGLLLFVYQVRKSEVAVVTLFGKIHAVQTDPGPGLRWPWPIENVYKLDQRVQDLEGKFEQIKLPDQNILLLSVFVGYRIDDPRAFFPKFANGSIPEADKVLEGLVRSAKNEVAGQHPFSDFVSTDEKQMKFADIENQILQRVQKQVRDLNYGIEIKFIHIRKIGLPESVTQNVFDRMTSERQFYISKIQSQGDEEATKIKSAADSTAAKLLADADAQAFKIRGEGEAQMMKSLEILQQNPNLATFNMQMTALEALLKKNATLVLDQSTSPLQWLRMNESIEATSTNLLDPK